MFCHLTKRVPKIIFFVEIYILSKMQCLAEGKVWENTWFQKKSMNFKAGNSDPSCRESDKMKKDALQDAGQSHESGHRISKGFLQD